MEDKMSRLRNHLTLFSEEENEKNGGEAVFKKRLSNNIL